MCLPYTILFASPVPLPLPLLFYPSLHPPPPPPPPLRFSPPPLLCCCPSLSPSLTLLCSSPSLSPPLQVHTCPSSWAPSQCHPCFENGSREGSILQVCAVYWVCIDTHTWLILNVTQLHNFYHVCMFVLCAWSVAWSVVQSPGSETITQANTLAHHMLPSVSMCFVPLPSCHTQPLQ